MRIERARLAGCCALAALACFVVGCPGKLEDKERFLDFVPTEAGPEAAAPMAGGPGAQAGAANDGSCGDIVDRVFAPSCGDTGCHGAVAPQEGLDLVSPGLAQRVVGVSGTGCSSTLADPTSPADSLLYKKLLPSPGCGAQMPLARPALSAADTACVLAWIAAQ